MCERERDRERGKGRKGGREREGKKRREKYMERPLHITKRYRRNPPDLCFPECKRHTKSIHFSPESCDIRYIRRLRDELCQLSTIYSFIQLMHNAGQLSGLLNDNHGTNEMIYLPTLVVGQTIKLPVCAHFFLLPQKSLFLIFELCIYHWVMINVNW